MSAAKGSSRAGRALLTGQEPNARSATRLLGHQPGTTGKRGRSLHGSTTGIGQS